MDKLLEGSERAALADLVAELGPDAPTLCAGWTTKDLVIHLHICESRPDAWLAVPMGNHSKVLRRHFERVIDADRARDWSELVDRLRRGPQRGPTSHQWVRERMLLREYLIHHEDVRRANGRGIRTGIPELQDAAWKLAPGFAKRMVAVTGSHGVELVTPDGRSRVVKKGADPVRLRGEPLELLLYAFGRTEAAVVEILDHPDHVRVRDSSKLQALPRVPVAASSSQSA
jgi:uncharacterized protein (TIGR03085 family)